MRLSRQQNARDSQPIPRALLIIFLVVSTIFVDRFRLVATAFWIGLVVSTITALFLRKEWLAKTVLGLFYAWLLTTVLPFDIAFQRGSGLNFKIVPVREIQAFVRETLVKEEEKKGLEVNVDYVIYGGNSTFAPKNALLVTVPW